MNRAIVYKNRTNMSLEDKISKLPISKESRLNAITSGLQSLTRNPHSEALAGTQSMPLSSFNAKNNKTFSKALEEAIRTHEEQAYLEKLAKKFVSGKHDNYMLARSIVTDVHLSLEMYINWTIRILLTFGGSDVKLTAMLSTELGEAIQKIEYFKKLSLVTSFGLFSKEALTILKKVNDLRNAFAHGYDTKNLKYYYDGSTILQKKAIDKVVADQNKVMHEFSDFLVRIGYLKGS